MTIDETGPLVKIINKEKKKKKGGKMQQHLNILLENHLPGNHEESYLAAWLTGSALLPNTVS